MFEKEKAEKAIKKIIKIIVEQRKISNRDLLTICEQEGFRLMARGNDFHLVHELFEVAVNAYISQKHFQTDFSDRLKNSEVLAELKDLETQIPPQSWRSENQQQLQQFSTPPAIGFLMTTILNPGKADSIMEPSAGTGSLAVWLRIIGCKVQLNEISARRRSLLELQGFAPTAHDAEFLDDLMPDTIAFDGVLMNPPFSASGGRMKTNDSGFGFRHIRSALSRLKRDGKLVALLGTESGTKTEKSQNFWSEIADENELKAFIHLPKNAFYKYGTTTATSIVCLRKGKPTRGERWREKKTNILHVNCAALDECLDYIDIFN